MRENDNNGDIVKDIIDSIEKEPEASSRAAKIRAIREAVRNSSDYSAVPQSVQDVQSTQTYQAQHEAPSPEPLIPDYQQAQPVLTEKTPKKSGKKKKKKKKKSLKKRIRGLFPEKGDSALEVLRKIVFLISVIAVFVCGYLVGDYYFDLWRNNFKNRQIANIYDTYPPIYTNTEDELTAKPEEKRYFLLEGAKKLLDINRDVVGYMEIPTLGGEPIVKLPVVQAPDNFKYLDKGIDLRENRTGTLFLDWRNHFDHVKDHRLVDYNSGNLVVYGHNMGDDSMFGALKYYHRKDDYYENHPIIFFNSNYQTYTFKIFAFFILDAEDETETKFDCWNRLDFDSEDDFYWFVNEAKRRTIRTNDVDVKYGDQLLTLSTCNTYLGDRGRLIVMARKVRPGEDLYEGTKNSQRNPNIKWPTMYYATQTQDKYDPDAPFEPYGPDKKKDTENKDKKDEDNKSADKKKDNQTEETSKNPEKTEE